MKKTILSIIIFITSQTIAPMHEAFYNLCNGLEEVINKEFGIDSGRDTEPNYLTKEQQLEELKETWKTKRYYFEQWQKFHEQKKEEKLKKQPCDSSFILCETSEEQLKESNQNNQSQDTKYRAGILSYLLKQ